MIDIFAVVLVVLIVIGIKPVNRFKSFNENYLSIDSCNYYRGIFAVAIVFDHIAIRTHEGVMFRLFEVVGPYAVAVFFFISGYGLQKSYIKKGDEYQKRFLVSRLPTVLIPKTVFGIKTANSLDTIYCSKLCILDCRCRDRKCSFIKRLFRCDH